MRVLVEGPGRQREAQADPRIRDLRRKRRNAKNGPETLKIVRICFGEIPPRTEVAGD